MVKKVMCLEKVRNEKGIIQYYHLRVEDGQHLYKHADEIKAYIKRGAYEFINLQIDKAGRLIDKAEEKPKKINLIEKGVPSEAVKALLEGHTVRVYVNENTGATYSFNLDDFLKPRNHDELGSLVEYLHDATKKDVYFIVARAKEKDRFQTVIALKKEACQIHLHDYKGIDNDATMYCRKNSINGEEIPVEIDGNMLQCKTSKTQETSGTELAMLHQAKSVFDNEMKCGGTGAFRSTVRVFKEYHGSAEDLIKIIPEDFQRELHKAFIYYTVENSCSQHDIKKDIIEIKQGEGETVGKLAAYLVKKYGNLGYKFSKSVDSKNNFACGVYTKVPSSDSTEDWEKLLGNIKESRYKLGDTVLGLYIGHKEADSIKYIHDIEREVRTKRKLKPFEYGMKTKEDTVVYIINENIRNEFKGLDRKTMFNVVETFLKQLEKYGITAEIHCRLGEGFIKLYHK